MTEEADAILGAMAIVGILIVMSFFGGYFLAEEQSEDIARNLAAYQDSQCKACMTGGEFNDHKWINKELP